jgi:hypothetical protein
MPGHDTVKTFALCCASFELSVKRAAGVPPLLAPPLTLRSFPHQMMMEGYQLLYFKLHGLPDQPYWYGDDLVTVMSAYGIGTTNLTGTVAFVCNCHLDGSPMLDALLKAGCDLVIGGAGVNDAAKS